MTFNLFDDLIKMRADFAQLVSELNEKVKLVNIEKRSFTGLIAAVDSGVATRSFSGVDLIAIKPAFDLFNYENSKLRSCELLPSKIPRVKVFHNYTEDNFSFQTFKSLVRLREEIKLALLAVKSKPVLILMDGSIVVQLSDKPPFDAKECFEIYKEVCSLYARLYAQCIESEIILAGVIKDSRGTRFSKHYFNEFKLSREPKSDALLLNQLLPPLARTPAITYAKDVDQSLLKDIGGHSVNIYSMYAKLAIDDAIRIDFLSTESPEKTASEICSALSSMCSAHKGYPAILINVDLRSMIKNGEFEIAMGPKVIQVLNENKLRGENRQFR